ncbi:DUF3857 domain-containing protein [Dokdonia sp.]|uniref:DUF3857 domain-containing protein n=1 Tax=Dokdonia sp. TaxID=2024995 RepID=UPI003263DC60
MIKFLLTTISIVFLSQCVDAQNYKFGKVSKEELAQTAHASDPEASAAVLYRKTSTKFTYSEDDGFVVVTDHHERIKIYNKDGYDLANQQIGMYLGSSDKESVASLKAVTYNLVDGSVKGSKLQSNGVFDEERSKTLRIKKFTMPDIQDGCIIEFKYTFTSPFISTIDEFRFQEEIPVDKVEMRFFAPEYLIYRTHGKGSIPLGLQTTKKARTLRFRYERQALARATEVERGTREVELTENGYIVNLENIPALKEEPFAGNINNYMSALQFELSYTKYPNSLVRNYATTWEDVAKKIYKSDGFGKELEQTKYFRKDIDVLIAGISDPKEKMMKVYDYVKTKMNWNKYYGVYVDKGSKKAYSEGVGNVADINLMLIAMLNYAGIETNPILLSTKANGIPFFPTRTGFNYVIAGAILDNRLFLLDGVDKTSSPSILKTNLLNWKGRMVKADGSSLLVDLLPAKPAVHTSLINLEINEDLVIIGNSKNRFTGHYAKGQRARYKSLNEDEQSKKMEENFESVQMIDHTFKEMDNSNKPLTLEYNFENEEAVEAIGNKMYISPLLHLATKENYFKAETRSYPIDYLYPRSDKYNISIKIPEGYMVESLPEPLSINLTDNMGSFRYGVSENGGKVTITLLNAIKTPVMGAEFYKDLQEYYKMILEKEAEKIVFVKS